MSVSVSGGVNLSALFALLFFSPFFLLHPLATFHSSVLSSSDMSEEPEGAKGRMLSSISVCADVVGDVDVG